jgi:hypothetical protein
MLNGIVSTKLAHLSQRVAELRRWQAARAAAARPEDVSKSLTGAAAASAPERTET